MAERNSGDDQNQHPGDDQKEGPGEDQEQDNEEPTQKDLVIDQATLLPGSHLVSTKSGTTEIGQGRRKDRREQKPEESHYPLVSGQDLMPRARAAKAKTKAKEKERKKESKTKESRAKAKVSQAKGEVARHPHPLHAKDLQQPWWNQGTASSLQMSRNTRTTVRKRKVPRQRPE